MNFILTSLWLGFMTLLGYFVGNTFTPEYVVPMMIGFFFLGLVFRFPKVLGDVAGALAD